MDCDRWVEAVSLKPKAGLCSALITTMPVFYGQRRSHYGRVRSLDPVPMHRGGSLNSQGFYRPGPLRLVGPHTFDRMFRPSHQIMRLGGQSIHRKWPSVHSKRRTYMPRLAVDLNDL